jgi:hypothetical protein
LEERCQRPWNNMVVSPTLLGDSDGRK